MRQLDDVFDRAGLERAAHLRRVLRRLHRACATRRAGRSGSRRWCSCRLPAPAGSRASSRLPGSPGRGCRRRSFVATSPLRLWPEVRAALPPGRRGWHFVARQGLRCLAAPLIPSLMAASASSCAAAWISAATARRVACADPGRHRRGRARSRRPGASTRSILPSSFLGADYRRARREPDTSAILTAGSCSPDIVSDFVHANSH